MKIKSFIISSCLLISCEDSVTQQSFDFEKAAGIWVPYEIRYPDGRIITEISPLDDIFAPYMCCLKLNADQTFTPIIWIQGADFSSVEPTGTCTYSERTKKLTFSAEWTLEFDLTKFNDEILWLKSSDALFKFERK